MVATEVDKREARVLELFAELLDYPHPGLVKTARECSAAVAEESADAAKRLEEFAAFLERTSFDLLEEIFTGTFDLNAMRHPYIGYHLFGEAYKRSVFMLELRDRYGKIGFDHGTELPDHIAVMLRFMARCPDREAVAELARDALLPSVEPMMAPPEIEELAEEDRPPVFDIGDDYSRVLDALRLILASRFGPPSELEVIPLPDQSRLVS
ncbi:MAG: molecular chaperone TorD family protein [Candidatus Eremiobacteraeota bacterium]|nr:molecular chaperone TorD family protein [Candidatus Eremiobacteraeota bacterium]